jgi:twinkle protein
MQLEIEKTMCYSDIFDNIEDMYDGKINKGFDTGWNNFKDKLSIKTGYLMVVGGYSFRGKSFFVDNLMLNLSENYGWRHLLFTFEVTVEKHLKQTLSMRTRKSFYGDNRMTKEEMDREKKVLDDYFIFSQNDSLWDIPSIIQKIEEVHSKMGIKTVLIDPYNRISKDIGRTSETHFIERMLSELSFLAKRLDILIIFIAHPTKPERKGTEVAPTMYETAGSQSWLSICDYGLIVHRDRFEDGTFSKVTKIIIDKVKTDDLGTCGTVNLKWQNQRLIDTAEGY